MNLAKDSNQLVEGLHDVAEGLRRLCDTVLEHERRLQGLEKGLITELESLRPRILCLPEEKQEEAWKLFYELAELLGLPVAALGG